MRRTWKSACIVAATIVALLAPAAGASAAEPLKLTFVLDFISLGRHAPWYVALGKGYYKDEGLDVTIMPSKGTADAIRTVVSGGAELGFIDIPSLVASGSAGSAIKIVAVDYQKPPYCVFSLDPGADITQPKQLAGLEFGSSGSSFIPRIVEAFMKMNHVDGPPLKVVNIDASARVAMLAARKVPAIDQFIMAEPSIRRAVTDARPVCLLLGDFGLDIYSNSIGTTEAFLDKNPAAVRGFVKASLRGWRDALANPEEAARIERQYVPTLDPAIIVDELKVLKRIAIDEDVVKHGFGTMSLEKMKRTVDFMNDNVEIPGDKLTASEIYRPGYLPTPPIFPAN